MLDWNKNYNDRKNKTKEKETKSFNLKQVEKEMVKCSKNKIVEKKLTIFVFRCKGKNTLHV